MAAAIQTEKVQAQSTHDDNDAVMLRTDRGATAIQPHVVAKIAGLAVREVPGVERLVPYNTSQSLTSFANSIRRVEMRDLGVNVEVGKLEAACDIRIVTTYGMSIPDIAGAIRDSVASRILQMTGLKVTEVNIEITDLAFADEQSEVEPTSSRVQ